jgi:hypothetical protein
VRRASPFVAPRHHLVRSTHQLLEGVALVGGPARPRGHAEAAGIVTRSVERPSEGADERGHAIRAVVGRQQPAAQAIGAGHHGGVVLGALRALRLHLAVAAVVGSCGSAGGRKVQQRTHLEAGPTERSRAGAPFIADRERHRTAAVRAYRDRIDRASGDDRLMDHEPESALPHERLTVGAAVARRLHNDPDGVHVDGGRPDQPHPTRLGGQLELYPVARLEHAAGAIRRGAVDHHRQAVQLAGSRRMEPLQRDHGRPPPGDRYPPRRRLRHVVVVADDRADAVDGNAGGGGPIHELDLEVELLARAERGPTHPQVTERVFGRGRAKRPNRRIEADNWHVQHRGLER